jgi:hypothetical protein
LRYFTQHTEKKVAVCAPTGVAALNVEGQTIHSLFFLPIGLIGKQDLTISAVRRKMMQSIETLIIDEISMVNADVMDGIDRATSVIDVGLSAGEAVGDILKQLKEKAVAEAAKGPTQEELLTDIRDLLKSRA